VAEQQNGGADGQGLGDDAGGGQKGGGEGQGRAGAGDDGAGAGDGQGHEARLVGGGRGPGGRGGAGDAGRCRGEGCLGVVDAGEGGAGAGGGRGQGRPPRLERGDDAVGGSLGLLLVAVVRRAHGHRPARAAAARAQGAAALLHDVGQLVRQQVLTRRAVRLVRPRAEKDIRAHGKGDGRHAPVERVGLGIGVDAHQGEVHPKNAFQPLAHRGLQRLPAPALRPDAPRERRAERPALPAHLRLRLHHARLRGLGRLAPQPLLPLARQVRRALRPVRGDPPHRPRPVLPVELAARPRQRQRH